MLGLFFAIAVAAASAADQPITAPGPQAPLAGSLALPRPDAPIVLILPGSGPTDRDGNSRLGVAAAPYRLLAGALAARGIGSVRIDKRGIGGSRGAVADGNAVTIADYVADTRAWIGAIRARTGVRCVWLAGHSEGALIALATAQRPAGGVCGVITIAGAGRPVDAVIAEQLRANPANAPLLPAATVALAKLKAGEHVAADAIPAPLLPLFAPAVQDYLIDLFRYDPARLAASVTVPLTIIQGTRDLQVAVADARLLAAANPRARLVLVDGVNHVLKAIASDDRAANLARYTDASAPIAPAVAAAVVAAVRGQ